ncbi:DNA-binding protein [Halorubrum sp. BOL3-1]|uniref:helix-turn-helix domain-containing protein n=1 Tax=Halorubrum sp. BOL3-1 TaxID=2497325 RepID=UPI001004FD96|nr:helix-turn-helix domain-containing protein [Halorubrum sp. BOL3-1]QAU14004.1 DNA-binding protein [Halorubrum sp. BOL3-1]
MSDIKTVVRIKHPDIVLTGTVAHDPTSNVRSVSEAGTDPRSGKFFYHVESSDFNQFEDGLRNDHTVGEFEQVIVTRDGKAIYSFEYTDEAKVFSPVISTANGVVLDMENDGNAWIFTVWMPERTNLAELWENARRHDIDIELLRVNEYASLGNTDAGLTDSQREALLVAFEAGYFEEPRNATLGEVAAELDISQPAAGGLLRRGIERLIISSLTEDGERTD